MSGTNIDHLSLAVLDNFESHHDNIELTQPPYQLSIVRLETLDKRTQLLLDQHFSDGSLITRSASLSLPRNPTNALLYHFVGSIPEPFRENYDLMFGPPRLFRTVVATLQIAKDGAIGCFPEHDMVSGIEAFTRIADPFIMSNGREIPYEPISTDNPLYSLEDETEIQFVQQILKTLNGTTPALKVALRRLNRQFGREDLADRILDAAIALEALYLYGASGELKYRLSLRVATHLGHDAAEKQWLFKLIDIVYYVRSKIAHGELYSSEEIKEKLRKDYKNSEWASSEAILSDLVGVLRKALKSILIEVGEKQYKDSWLMLTGCAKRRARQRSQV
ncbi:MAG: hypothetical protein ABI947_26840 [Chloroflexota bacterium]